MQARAPEVLGTDIDMGAYLQFMAEMPIGVHWPIVHKARELKAGGTPIALLTNNVAEWGDNWRSTIPVDELFEIVVDSSAVQLRKPDPAIYLLTCERIGVAPEAAVFLDDNHDNIAAARALGMETVTVDEDPFVAVAELEAIIERRSHRLTRFRHARRRTSAQRAETVRVSSPAIVMSATSRVTPAVPPGSQVRSAPTSTTSCSIRCSVDATVISRTGSAN